MKKETRREIKEMKRSDIKEKQLEVLALAVGDIHVLVKKEGKKMYTDHIEWEAHLFWVLGRGGAGQGRQHVFECATITCKYQVLM